MPLPTIPVILSALTSKVALYAYLALALIVAGWYLKSQIEEAERLRIEAESLRRDLDNARQRSEADRDADSVDRPSDVLRDNWQRN